MKIMNRVGYADPRQMFQPARTIQSTQKEKANAQKTPHFSGWKEDELFLRSVYQGNPFAKRVEQINKSLNNPEVVTVWEASDDSQALTTKLRNNRYGVPQIVGTYTGAHSIASLPIYRTQSFSDAALSEQKIKAEYRAKELKPKDSFVRQSCRHVDHNMNNWYLFWFNKQPHVAGFLKGFISRYDKEQQFVKDILPKIRGKENTREVLVPELERLSREDYLEDRPRVVTLDFLMAANAMGSPMSYFPRPAYYVRDNSVTQAASWVDRDMEDEIEAGIIPKEVRDTNDGGEGMFYELRGRLPSIIEYLDN